MGNIKRRRFKSDASDYAIGFCKPPRHSQYKPGQSGYLKGRPKGARELQDHRRDYVESTSESNPRRQIAENINAGGHASASARKGASAVTTARSKC